MKYKQKRDLEKRWKIWMDEMKPSPELYYSPVEKKKSKKIKEPNVIPPGFYIDKTKRKVWKKKK